MSANILIVDDDEMIRRTLHYLLRQRGFEACQASGGFEAQRMFEQGGYEVALIDLRMPEMDGLELLQWMETNAKDVIPIVLSGTTRVEDAVQAVQRGAFDFIAKPIESSEVLAQHIERALAHKRLADSNRRLMAELQEKNIELENRLGQLEVAHSMLQTQALAIQVDLDRAMRIQQSLLPEELPFSERIALCALYRPAAKVGGDLYDIFRLDERHVGLYVADTSGHGIASALLTIFLKHSIVPTCTRDEGRTIVPPDEVLGALNSRLLSEAFGQDLFISMAYIVLDTETFDVVSSSAGHPPLLLRREKGDIEIIHIPAPALGINPNVVYSKQSFHMGPDDLLLLHTDGVTEAANVHDKQYGSNRLKQTIAKGNAQVEQAVRDIEAGVIAFCDSEAPIDDITIVALSKGPQVKPFKTVRTLTGRKEALTEVPASVGVATVRHNGCVFIHVSGTGSWRESRQVLDLCDAAREDGHASVVIDFEGCTHLDSTFLGVLHNIAAAFDQTPECSFEIQRIPDMLMSEISELGLTNLMMHCRPEAMPLPETLNLLKTKELAHEEMGRLVLRAHEALVDADPTNADRFAAVLLALHQKIEQAATHAP